LLASLPNTFESQSITYSFAIKSTTCFSFYFLSLFFLFSFYSVIKGNYL